MDERAADAEVVSIDDLLDRVRREGPVLRFNNDVVGIFDPALAVRVVESGLVGDPGPREPNDE